MRSFCHASLLLTHSSSAAIEKGKGVVEVLSALGSTFGKQETVTIEGGAALGSLFSEMSRTFKLFEMFYANFVRPAPRLASS